MGLDSLNTVDGVMQIFLLYYIYICVCVCVYVNYDDSVHIISTLICQVLINMYIVYIKLAAVSDICVNYAFQ